MRSQSGFSVVRIDKERRDGDESSPRRIPSARQQGGKAAWQRQMCSAVPKHQMMRTVSVFDKSARISSLISEAVDVCTEHNTGEKISPGNNWLKTLQAARKVGVQVQPTNPNGKPNPLTPNQTC